MRAARVGRHELGQAARPVADDERRLERAFDGVFEQLEPSRLMKTAKHDASARKRALLFDGIVFLDREILIEEFIPRAERAVHEVVLEARGERLDEIVLGDPSLRAVQVPQHDDSVNVEVALRRRKHGVQTPLVLAVATKHERLQPHVVIHRHDRPPLSFSK